MMFAFNLSTSLFFFYSWIRFDGGGVGMYCWLEALERVRACACSVSHCLYVCYLYLGGVGLLTYI